MPKIIMIVDDDKSAVAVQREYLEEVYQVIIATSAESAITRLNKVVPNLILLDYRMPGMNGVEMLDSLQANPRTKEIPVIIVTSAHDAKTEKACFEHGAADFITKPFVGSVLLERVKRIIEFWELRGELSKQVDKKTKEVDNVIIESVKAIANTIDAKDAYTKGHSERVAEFAAMIAQELGWDKERIRELYNMALLHDIGKIGIPDSILNKPGRLSNSEFGIIKQHTVTGGFILEGINNLKDAQLVAKYHHERYDGTGYPDGLKGEQIPMAARVIAVADAFDAMTSNRVYRKKLQWDYVMEELRRGKGTQFDPKAVTAFIQILEREPQFQDEKEAQQKEGFAERLMPEILNRQQNMEHLKETHDPVSKLYKNSYGIKLIENLPASEEWSYCMVDIEHFKKLNLVYGRIQGDYVLQLMAEVIQKYLSEDEIAYRINGSKFGICLRHRTREEVEVFAKGIIQDFLAKKEQIPIMEICDVSVGIAMTITEGKNFQQILRDADCALYYASNKTKDKYAFFTGHVTQQNGLDLAMERLTAALFSQEERERLHAVTNPILIEKIDEVAGYVEKCGSCSLIIFQLFTVKEPEEYDKVSASVNNLELAVIANAHEEDDGMHFGSSRYLLMTPEKSKEELQNLIERISRQYYRLDNSSMFELEYGLVQRVTKE